MMYVVPPDRDHLSVDNKECHHYTMGTMTWCIQRSDRVLLLLLLRRRMAALQEIEAGEDADPQSKDRRDSS